MQTNYREILDYAKKILLHEGDAIRSLVNRLDVSFSKAVEVILFQSNGHVVVIGMGKPGFIAQKISATLSSTGTPSIYLHPAEAYHGDLGRVVKNDVVIILSNSGETEEIVKVVPLLKKIGTPIIAITGNDKSTLADASDVVINIGSIEEACPIGLAPSASTTAMLAIGDALALTVLSYKGFTKEEFLFYHPGGEIGRKFLKVSDLMRTGEKNPVVKKGTLVKDVLKVITKSRAGAVSIVGVDGCLVGIFTDGDLRRHVDITSGVLSVVIDNVMTKKPTTISPNGFASEAARLMREKKIDELPVVDENNRPVGLIDIQDLLEADII
jgi:arabinose-5-phosphate isomerase